MAVFSAGFDTGDLTEFDSSTDTGADMTVSSTAPLSGTHSLQIVRNDTTASYVSKTFGDVVHSRISWDVWFDPAGTWGSRIDARIMESSDGGTQALTDMLYEISGGNVTYRARFYDNNGNTGEEIVGSHAHDGATHNIAVETNMVTDGTGTVIVKIDGVTTKTYENRVYGGGRLAMDRFVIGEPRSFDSAVNGTLKIDNVSVVDVATEPVDDTAPIIVSQPTVINITGTTATVQWETDEDSTTEYEIRVAAPVLKVEVRVNGGAWVEATGTTAWSTTINAGDLVAGQNTIEARAYDSAEPGGATSATIWHSPDGLYGAANTPGDHLIPLEGEGYGS